MTKVKMLFVAMFALFALSAVAAGTASAANNHRWLNLAGESLTKAEPALTDGLLLLHHKPPAILGGGSILIHCDGQFHGTVGPNDGSTGLEAKDNGLDLISDVLTLTGVLNSIPCEVLESTNGFCPAGEKVTVIPIHLPWSSELLLFENKVYDHLKEHVTEPKGQPGYETTCKSIKTSCSGLDRSDWLGNDADGALFEFLGTIVNSCSDGGTGTVLGVGLVLDFFVS